jgi:dienelactone hydrolase
MKMLVAVLIACVAMIFPMASAAGAAVRMETYPYGKGEVRLLGQIAWDDAAKGPRPAVLVVHEWWGLNDYARERAKALASMGYIALAADIYGEGFETKDPSKARELAGKFREGNRALLRERVVSALAALKAHPLADKSRVAAIGYCFGGTAVLELARSGAELNGVVSFHGGLSTTVQAPPGGIRTKVLVLHGADDPSVPPADVQAFQDEMRKSGADWLMVSYGGAVHTFTNPAAGNDPSRGSAYNEKAALRSWEHMKDFFAEIFR